ncbi:lipoprotein-releasing ABC transporter permease subunit [Pseudoalteromonas luteoviolacea]|uniref:lipoprotein-releasing ABC transporter permease subunit n=1 Tax=Pseudoalteromonas luteoviolacea TaxID=43657 RepID=UPI001B369F88|nr:lipoprotein-releasing ABC transporter permease subunit [Pseudoalteromonas luteoviolacea]MBQ4809869.1 lipoprotein-releasing ABC transporter permease subunit [Pseudoalteromonas luteoviolacea]
MLSLFLSKRLRESKNHSGLFGFLSKASTIGVFLGVTVLIVALSVINGFEHQLKERLLSVVPHVSYQAPYDPIENWPAKVKLLEAQVGVISAAPEINLTAMIQHRGKLKAAQLKAIEPNKHQHVSSIGQYIKPFNLSQLSSEEILLGREIAEQLHVKEGDKVTILIANQHAKNALAAPKRVSFKVAGFISMGGEVDRNLAIVSLAKIQKALSLTENTVTGLRLAVDDVFNAHQIAMSAGRALPDLVYVQSWFRTQGSLYQDIQMVRTIVYLVVFLIIAVASFNIISSMVMEVKEKQADIAILKTMGTQDKTIFMTFAVQGLSYAMVGALFGLILGTAVALSITDLFSFWISLDGANPLQGIYFIEFLPSKLAIADIAIVLGATLIISVLSSVYPAWQATKIEPARVLGGG